MNFANNGEHIYGIIPTDSYVGGFYESVGTAVGNAAPEFFANANAWTLLGGTLALSAGIAVGGYAIGSAALPAGMLGLSGASFTHGLLQTYAANPNAGLGAYASAGGLGAVFGAFVPGAGIGGLAGSVGGGAIGSAFGNTNLGVQFGGLAGDLVGGGLAAGSRRAALTNLAYQGGGAGIGALAGGLYYGNARGALFGANLGAFGGGIAQGGVGLYRKLVPRKFSNTKQFQFADRTWFEDIEGYRALKANIATNGIKNRIIEYVEISGQRYVVRGNARLQIAEDLGIADELIFKKVDLPFLGYRNEADVIEEAVNIIYNRPRGM